MSGTAANVITEFLTHPVDTMNILSKQLGIKRGFTYKIVKQEGFFSLYKGLQPVLYGYIISSYIYFYMYIQLKEKIAKLVVLLKLRNPETDILSI